MNELEKLRDIHLPSEVNWWPLAIGWWILLAVILVTLVLLMRYLKQRRQRQQRLKLLSDALDNLANNTQLDQQQWLAELSTLLRRMVIRLHGRQTTAGLVGEEWLVYLDQSGGTDQFTQGVGKVLASSPYQPLAEYEREALLKLSHQWIKHQVKGGRSHA